jgi:hypothetical protein
VCVRERVRKLKLGGGDLKSHEEIEVSARQGQAARYIEPARVGW